MEWQLYKEGHALWLRGLKGERGRLNSDEVQAPDTTPQIIPEMAKISPMLNGHPQITERELTSANDGNVAEDLMQNHDVFLSTLWSHLTKLQVVRHFWEQNNIKGAIDATRKLPDHSVGIFWRISSVLLVQVDQYSHEENGDSHLRFALNMEG
ncbi:hypothetical protein CsSME_00030175 [Camellia sinensis var. sinensis]